MELARHGAQIALSARNEPALHDLAGEIGNAALVLPLDVTNREANVATARAIVDYWGGLDIAIFNAGITEPIDVRNFDSLVFQRIINVNFLSMVYGIEAALPLLRESLHPHLVGMSSTIAYAGLPPAEAYGASKAAIRNMLEGLRIHLREERVPVTVICAGFVRTPLTDRNNFPMPLLIEVEEAARCIADGIARQTEEIHFPKAFSLTCKFLSSLPSPLYTRLMSFILKMAVNGPKFRSP